MIAKLTADDNGVKSWRISGREFFNRRVGPALIYPDGHKCWNEEEITNGGWTMIKRSL